MKLNRECPPLRVRFVKCNHGRGCWFCNTKIRSLTLGRVYDVFGSHSWGDYHGWLKLRNDLGQVLPYAVKHMEEVGSR